MSEKCVRTKRRSIAGDVPGRVARFQMLQRYGNAAFMMPEGTPARPGVPAYPVMTKDGCFDCNFAKAAYNRMSQQMKRSGQPTRYRNKLKERRLDLVTRTLRLSNPDDQANACNFSIAASKRLHMRFYPVAVQRGG